MKLNTENVWHANDCDGACDGCGHIAEDGFWYAGPCPEHLVKFQQAWAEGWTTEDCEPAHA